MNNCRLHHLCQPSLSVARWPMRTLASAPSINHFLDRSVVATFNSLPSTLPLSAKTSICFRFSRKSFQRKLESKVGKASLYFSFFSMLKLSDSLPCSIICDIYLSNVNMAISTSLAGILNFFQNWGVTIYRVVSLSEVYNMFMHSIEFDGG